jgi:hypothetical protein
VSLETGLYLTFALSCLSALFFLRLRCRDRGQPFGPQARRWALPVIVAIGAASTVSASLLDLLGYYAPATLFVFGIAAPGSLCIERLREDLPRRRSAAEAAATLWLSWLLSRLDDAMADDKSRWIETRIDFEWPDHTMLLAARHYHNCLYGRLPEEEREGQRIDAALEDIEARLDIARLIDSDLPPGKIRTEITASPLGSDPRYQRNLDDLTMLGRRLRHDSAREIDRLLAVAYGNGLYRLERYRPPVLLPGLLRYLAGPSTECRISSGRAPTAVSTPDRVRSVRFSSPDRIWLTRPGETPISWARSARVILCSLMNQLTSSTNRRVRSGSRSAVARRMARSVARFAMEPPCLPCPVGCLLPDVSSA